MKRRLVTRLAAASATAALAFGAAACQVEDDGMSPGQEDPMMDDGAGTLDDPAMDDGGMTGEGSIEGEGEADF